MSFKVLLMLATLPFHSCNNSVVNPIKQNNVVIQNDKQDNPYKYIKDIPLPEGFKRIEGDNTSFMYFLQNIELKKNKTVYKFDGTPKLNQSAQFAVLDISVGTKDLQQCADAVMRLRAEYLFSLKKYAEICFKDNNGTKYQFTTPYSKDNLIKYLQRVFGMCGSASLSKELKQAEFSTIQSGDVIIRGGFPGHAVIVMDVAENKAGEKIYLLAQSYMPAQDIHVLVNPMDENLSPWYKVNNDKTIETPEYLFYRTELKRWVK